MSAYDYFELLTTGSGPMNNKRTNKIVIHAVTPGNLKFYRVHQKRAANISRWCKHFSGIWLSKYYMLKAWNKNMSVSFPNCQLFITMKNPL